MVSSGLTKAAMVWGSPSVCFPPPPLPEPREPPGPPPVIVGCTPSPLTSPMTVTFFMEWIDYSDPMNPQYGNETLIFAIPVVSSPAPGGWSGASSSPTNTLYASSVICNADPMVSGFAVSAMWQKDWPGGGGGFIVEIPQWSGPSGGPIPPEVHLTYPMWSNVSSYGYIFPMNGTVDWSWNPTP